MSSSANGACEECGKPLPQPKRSGRNRKYCGATCRSAARRHRDAAAPNGPFATALRGGIRAAPLTLRPLSRHLGDVGYHIAPGTLSNWQRGKHLPWLNADIRNTLLAIERLLDLPPATLVAALMADRDAPKTARAGSSSVRSEASLGRLERRCIAMERELRRLGVIRTDLALIKQSEHYCIGGNRRPVFSRFDLEACAIGDQVASYWYVYLYEPTVQTRFNTVYGCRLGRLVEEEWRAADQTARRFRAVELRFDPPRRLARGETHRFAYELRYPDAASNDPAVPLAEREFFRHLTTPACRELRLAIEFTGQQKPINLHRSRLPLRSEKGASSTTVTLSSGRDEIIEIKPAPGAYGWQWEWPGADQVAPLLDGNVVAG